MNLLKAPLNRISPTRVVSILSGPLRGKKWIVGASRHAYWLGLYEKEKTKHFMGQVKPSQIVYDVGAHVGYYSLLAATRVGPAGHVWAFEPAPQNFTFLKQHMELNHVSNVTLVPGAVANVTGTTHFRMDGSRSTGRLSDKGDLAVSTTSLDDLIERQEALVPHVIKLDVEGAELAALQGATNLLRRAHPKLYVATHSAQLHKACIAFLSGIGYQVTVLDWNEEGHLGELFAA